MSAAPKLQCRECRYWSEMLAEAREGVLRAMCLCDGGPRQGQWMAERATCERAEEGSPVDEPGIPEGERYLPQSAPRARLP